MTVEQENERAIAAENTIAANLNNEVNRATAKETELAGSIQEVSTSLETMRGNVSNALAAENGRAEAEEQRIEGRIDVQKWGFNVTDVAHLQEPIVLEDAVLLVPVAERKPGMKITFWTNGGWQTWQFFNSLDVRYWPLPEYWHQEEGITDKLLDGAVTTEKIKNGAVTTDKLAIAAVSASKIAAEAVTPGKLHPNVVPQVIRPVVNELGRQVNAAIRALDAKYKKITDDLLQMMRTLEIGGLALRQEFGTETMFGVSQKVLTDAFNKLWEKLEDITGEVYQGISMVVTPTYFISENSCTVHIKASTVEANGIFESIAFYGNGQLIRKYENTDYIEFDTELTETTVIRCVAKIMGVEYTREQIVTHYNSFWLGAGATYADIMDVEHVIPITNGMRGNHDVEVAEGDHIIVIVGESLSEGFTRADMNGVELPFVESTVTVDGVNYKVFTSVNTYAAGTYNIDINS